MRVTVVGTGYVGLVSGVCLAAKGHDVTCVDINPRIVESLNRGVPTIYENGLEELLRKTIREGRFRATSNLREALSDSDGVIIAVGTPSENGVIDLTYVREVARDVGGFVKTHDSFLPIVVKSTVVPGTTDTVVRQEVEGASGKRLGEFGLGMNPEFLREGDAVSDFMCPDRIVLGYEDGKTLAFLKDLYSPWDCEKLCVNTRTAEMIKYSNNALLAVQISAVNELANLAGALGGIDIVDVMKGIHLDKRWNPVVGGKRVEPEILTYLMPGCGFGGSCFPKDVQALRSQGEHVGLPMRMLNSVLTVNEKQPLEVIEILERELGSLAGKTCLILGLAFKPGTDDVRETASLPIIRGLLEHGAVVAAHDPIATENFRRAMGAGNVAFHDDWKAALPAAEVVVVATRWPEYRELGEMSFDGKVIFDARRLLAGKRPAGARYLSIGLRV